MAIKDFHQPTQTGGLFQGTEKSQLGSHLNFKIYKKKILKC